MKVGVDLVGAVNRYVNLLYIIQVDERDARVSCKPLGGHRCGHALDLHPICGESAQPFNHKPGGRAGPYPDNMAIADKLQGFFGGSFFAIV
jgi:hypothetical protein